MLLRDWPRVGSGWDMKINYLQRSSRITSWSSWETCGLHKEFSVCRLHEETKINVITDHGASEKGVSSWWTTFRRSIVGESIYQSWTKTSGSSHSNIHQPSREKCVGFERPLLIMLGSFAFCSTADRNLFFIRGLIGGFWRGNSGARIWSCIAAARSQGLRSLDLRQQLSPTSRPIFLMSFLGAGRTRITTTLYQLQKVVIWKLWSCPQREV